MEVTSFRVKIFSTVCVIVVVLYLLVFTLDRKEKSQRQTDYVETMGQTGYQSEGIYNKKIQNRQTYTSSYNNGNAMASIQDARDDNFPRLKSDIETKPTINSLSGRVDISTKWRSKGRYNFLDLNCVSTLPDQLVGAVEDMPILIPESLAFPPEVLACLYHRYVTTKQTGCVEPKLFGNANNKGGYICVDEGILDKNNCDVYIFTRSVDERYKTQLKSQYGCNINTVEDANRNLFLETSKQSFLLKTLRQWIVSQSKSKSMIDLVVLDLSMDKNDIYVMNELLQAKTLMSRIKQISLRVYLPPKIASALEYEQRLLIFKQLFDLNFRIFHFNLDWECKPENIKKNKFLSCYSIYMMRPKRKDPVIFTLPSVDSIRGMDVMDRHKIFHRFVSSNQVLCHQNIRVGNVVSGGWNVCHDPAYRPSSPCLVYSFGINDDWTFDEDMVATYGCEVHSFDPSIDRKSYHYSNQVHFHNLGLGGKDYKTSTGWELRTVDTIMKMLGHSDRIIDILKMDAEGAEIPALKQMFKTGTLRKVRQLNVEYHGKGNLDMVLVAKNLHDLGFRIHWSNMNLACSLPIDGGFSTHCFEVYYISNHGRST
ncbi:hypothetical protein FSP39_003029 [Pinctada imbricata]|uniref:Methyltransferase domain-containing protein n=1 Tax=Pinctada imbricata TaxID=66713 RepID=A0AA88YAI6_PINIB|nr:hypothetical protein FSP39_003029 [Pinctada imbricata]